MARCFRISHTNSMSAICQVLLTQCLWYFKCRVLGTSRTDPNCHSDICPGDICPCQEFLSCYRPNFHENLKLCFFDHLYEMPTVLMTFFQGNVRAMSKQGQVGVKARSRQRQGKCSWVLMGALEWSWAFLSDPECSSSWFSNEQKMLIFKMTSF